MKTLKLCIFLGILSLALSSEISCRTCTVQEKYYVLHRNSTVSCSFYLPSASVVAVAKNLRECVAFSRIEEGMHACIAVKNF